MRNATEGVPYRDYTPSFGLLRRSAFPLAFLAASIHSGYRVCRASPIDGAVIYVVANRNNQRRNEAGFNALGRTRYRGLDASLAGRSAGPRPSSAVSSGRIRTGP